MKKHYKPMYVGTQAERIAMTLVAEAYGSMFWETDTSKWYKWTGAVWERSYTELELQTSGGAQVHWDNLTNVPQLFESNFYPHDDASGIGGYFSLFPDPPDGAEDIDSASVTAAGGEVLIEGYITEELNTILLQGGTWHFFNWNRVDNATGVSQMVIRVYKRSSVGVETELFNITTTEIDNTTVNAASAEVMTVQPDFIVANTDRLLVKYFAKTTSVAARTIYFYHDGTTHYSHIHTPFSMISVASGGSSGVSIPFTSLTDVPGSYAGQTGKVPAVNGTETGLEFIPAGGALALDDLTDVNAPTPSDGEVLTWDSTPGEWKPVAPTGGVASLNDIGDVNTPSPNDGDKLTWDATPGEWVAVAGGAASALNDLTDVQVPSPANNDILGYVGSVGLWEAVPAASIITVTYEGSTSNIGQDQDRNTGSSYTTQAGQLQFALPCKLTQVLWDIRNTGDYTMTVRAADNTTILATVGPITVSSAPAVDQAFTLAATLYLWPGTYFFRLARSGSATWSDKNASTFLSRLYTSSGILYDGGSFNFSIPARLIAYVGAFGFFAV